jgi:lipopolysaccharide/colanic/teichoic acid biosynthesis glycosyltransferase
MNILQEHYALKARSSPAASRVAQGLMRPAAASAAAARLIDVGIAILVTLCALPVMCAVAVLVRVSSRGPVLFRQRRVGRDGVAFWLLKFRTMQVGTDGPSVTAGGDARVTHIGRFLRQWKLDELPQLLNVLRGDMALVGPRPEVPEYVRHYSDEQRRVLSVRPGITGVSQLRFRHEESLLAGRADAEVYYLATIMPAKLELDLGYVSHRSLTGDLGLLAQTLAAIVARPPAGNEVGPHVEFRTQQ